MENLLFEEVFVFLKVQKMIFLIRFPILSLSETVFKLNKGCESGVFVSIQIQDNLGQDGDVAYMGKGVPFVKSQT